MFISCQPGLTLTPKSLHCYLSTIENGLPTDIVSDRDKLFVSWFWKALTKLTGVKFKMSSAYHLEMDNSSQHSNKTINQLLHYHVQCNQKGWVWALPHVHFQIMSTVNASIGFSGFQLHLRWSLHVIPPILTPVLDTELQDAAATVTTLLNKTTKDITEAHDNLL